MTTELDTQSISDVGWALATLFSELNQARWRRKQRQEDVDHFRRALDDATANRDEADRQIAEVVRAMNLLGFSPDAEETAGYVPCAGCGIRNYQTTDLTWNCPDFPQCAEAVA